MESRDKTALINEFSQEFLKKENLRCQTQSLYNLDLNQLCSDDYSDTTKIFVGGLPGDLTLEEFKTYFEQFGSIQDVVVMSDKLTNRPRGFGFVTFDSLESANNVITKRFYELKNKRVEVKKAVSKDRMRRNFLNNWDVYDAMYSNFGGYSYGTNSYGINGYGYGAYDGYGYQGLSYGYYPNQSAYQSLYGYNTTYSFQSPYCYGTMPYSSWFNRVNYRNRTPIVVKNPNVKDGDDSDVETYAKDVLINGDHGESVVENVLENGDNCKIVEALSLCCNGEGDESDGDGGCAKFIEALSLHRDGCAGKHIGVDGESSSCTDDS